MELNEVITNQDIFIPIFRCNWVYNKLLQRTNRLLKCPRKISFHWLSCIFTVPSKLFKNRGAMQKYYPKCVQSSAASRRCTYFDMSSLIRERYFTLRVIGGNSIESPRRHTFEFEGDRNLMGHDDKSISNPSTFKVEFAITAGTWCTRTSCWEILRSEQFDERFDVINRFL